MARRPVRALDPARLLLAANEAFYDAFNARDLGAMAELLAADVPVACIHPGWAPLIGREAAMEAWQALFAGPPQPPLVYEEPSGLLLGDAGLVICRERLGEAAFAASNLFVLERGLWRMAHHQAGPLAAGVAAPASRRLH